LIGFVLIDGNGEIIGETFVISTGEIVIKATFLSLLLDLAVVISAKK
jgi:hypothetical protein